MIILSPRLENYQFSQPRYDPMTAIFLANLVSFSLVITLEVACRSIFSVKLLSLSKTATLNPFPNKPWFLHVCSTNLLKTLWKKGEIARNEQCLLFP